MSNICPTEAQEGLVLVAYLRVKGFKFTHIPNETGGSPEAKRRAIRMKQQGTSRGFLDYLIIVMGSMVFIELKRQFGSKTSADQKEWVIAINEVGNCEAHIAYGAQDAITIIESILHNKVDKSSPLPRSNVF